MRLQRMVLAIVLSVLLCGQALAVTKIWVGTDVNYTGVWTDPNNWQPTGVPVTGDNVYLEETSQGVTSGLDPNSVLLASLNIAQSYTGSIGDDVNYLKICATKVEIGYNPGMSVTLTGSGRIKLNLDANQSFVTIHNSALTASETSMPPIRLLTNHASTVVEVRKGKVGIAYETGETSTLSKVISSYSTSKTTDSDTYIGAGTTLTTLSQTGGDVVLNCALTTATSEGGTLLTQGTGAITTLNAAGGTVMSNSTGTITTANISGGLLDFTKSAAARTVTTMKLDSGGQVKFDPSILTITNKIISNNPATYTASSL